MDQAGRSSCRDRTRCVFDRGRSVGTTLIAWPRRARRQMPRAGFIPTTRSTTGSSRRRRFARCTTPCRRAATSCCSRSFRRAGLPRARAIPSYRAIEAPVQPRHLSGVVEARADGRRRSGHDDRRADRRARSVLPRRACCSGLDARTSTRSRQVSRGAREPDLPRVRRRPHDLLRSLRRKWLAGDIDDAALRRRDPRELRSADRRVAYVARSEPRRERIAS